MLLKNLGTKNPTALLDAGIFINAFDGQILFIHKIEDNKMYNITIYQPQPDKPTRTIIAKRGEFTPVPGKQQIKLKLIDGTADEPNLAEGGSFYKVNFHNYFMTLDFSGSNKKLEKKPKSMSLKELRTKIHELEPLFINTTPFETEYWRKITWSFSPLVFIALGFPLAVITNKREKSANVILAIICAVIYYLLSLVCQALASEGLATPWLIMWTPNLIGLIAAGVLNYRCVS
jgi:lipopolysaccharide export LptBFGC system permease protein LptF